MQFIPSFLTAYFRMVWPTLWEWSLFLCKRKGLWKWESIDYCEQQWSWRMSASELLWGSGSGWIRLQELAVWPSVKVNCVEQMTVTYRSRHHLRGVTSKGKIKTKKMRKEAWGCMGEEFFNGWAWMGFYELPQMYTAWPLSPRGPTLLLCINSNIFYF